MEGVGVESFEVDTSCAGELQGFPKSGNPEKFPGGARLRWWARRGW
jgi:hypothetical protein